MKILFIEIDMLSTTNLGLYNNKISYTNLDKYFVSIGGTLFKNCFTSGADTPRAHSELWSGINCYNNGCITRAHYPFYFLSSKSFLKSFNDNGYKINIVSSKTSRQLGTFPNDLDYDFKEIYVGKPLNNFSEIIESIGINQNNREISYIKLDEYHSIINKLGANKYSVSKGIELIDDLLSVNNSGILNKFDYVFFLSDHGHLVQKDYKLTRFGKINDKILSTNLISFKRNNNFLLIRKKYDKNLVINDKLCQFIDISKTLHELCQIKNYYGEGINLFSTESHNIIYFEDFLKLYSTYNMQVEIWGFIEENKKFVLFRREDNLEETPDFIIQKLMKLKSFKQYLKINKVMSEYKKYLKNDQRGYIYTNLKKLINNFIHF